MADAVTLRVEGLKEFQGALRRIDRALGPELRKGLNEAAQVVIDAARPKVPHRSGKAQGSMKPRSSQRGAAIAVGGNAAPYFPFLDFGGSTGRGHKAGQAGSGAVKRPFIKKGRYVYPTLEQKEPQVIGKVDEVVRRLAIGAGFETRGTI